MNEHITELPWRVITYSLYATRHKKVICSQLNKCYSKYFLEVDLLWARYQFMPSKEEIYMRYVSRICLISQTHLLILNMF